ncbi:hydrolase [Halovivax cerinus]|uniref:Membrane-associated, metal-dependent hydrolase n=1 Tax=Halovivax cerinus TaxID=1487865 RepID=A0ABD5NQY8_9EURY|nr:hydrolase [Halovivax cerinus]
MGELKRLLRTYLGRLGRTRDRAGARAAVSEAVRMPWQKTLQLANSVTDSGENVFDRDWDLLIVVDACRYDLLCEALDDQSMDRVRSVESARSVNSATPRWMRQTFEGADASSLAETVYVCGNPYSMYEVPTERFLTVDEVWTYAWDDSLGTLPPRPVTDRAITADRTADPDRLLVHYMQPHCPFVGFDDLSRKKSADEFGTTIDGLDVWGRLKLGEVERTDVWDAYRDTLEYVLDDIELLCENVDREQVVLTSDHGNALGELGMYGHPPNMPLSCLRTVPWVELTATDTGAYEPTMASETTATPNTEERLAALGYR